MHRVAADYQGGHPLGDQYPRLDRGTGRDDGGPPVGLEAAFGGQLRGDLTEHLRLQFRQIGQPAAHAAGGVMLGESIRGEHVRVYVGAGITCTGRTQIVLAREDHSRGILLLRIERVGDGRLLRFVVRWQRSVHHTLRSEQPALAVGLHDERVVASERGGTPELGVGAAARRPVDHEVGHVVPDPQALLLVPPDQLLALAPRLAVRVG